MKGNALCFGRSFHIQTGENNSKKSFRVQRNYLGKVELNAQRVNCYTDKVIERGRFTPKKGFINNTRRTTPCTPWKITNHLFSPIFKSFISKNKGQNTNWCLILHPLTPPFSLLQSLTPPISACDNPGWYKDIPTRFILKTTYKNNVNRPSDPARATDVADPKRGKRSVMQTFRNIIGRTTKGIDHKMYRLQNKKYWSISHICRW